MLLTIEQETLALAAPGCFMWHVHQMASTAITIGTSAA